MVATVHPRRPDAKSASRVHPLVMGLTWAKMLRLGCVTRRRGLPHVVDTEHCLPCLRHGVRGRRRQVSTTWRSSLFLSHLVTRRRRSSSTRGLTWEDAIFESVTEPMTEASPSDNLGHFRRSGGPTAGQAARPAAPEGRQGQRLASRRRKPWALQRSAC